MGRRRRTITLVIGETVGSYKIVSKLSVGGMGTVYKAEHTLIGKLAAVKVLHPELSRVQDLVNRFFNEAKATTSIKHPGIVEIFDFGYMESGHAYLIMEFLDGMSLARRCKTGGKMGEGDAAMLLRGVCSALSAAHAKGIVHRDLKPDNIFLVPDPDTAIGERTKVLDFGIAKLTDVGPAGSATKTGAVMGTPTYMSPEQCRGTGVVDQRADLYSMGCIFHELLTGRPPFVNLGAGELIGAHLYVEPPRPSEVLPTISRESEKLIMALLSKDPNHRPQTAKELGQWFQRIAELQGWITHNAPSGITDRVSLPLLTPPLAPATIHDRPGSRIEAVDDSPRTLPSKPPGATTPSGMTPPALFVPTKGAGSSDSLGEIQFSPTDHDASVDVDAPTEKPTTLSGAASQQIRVPRRSRRGLGLAMAAAAFLAGGSVAFIKLYNTDTPETAAAARPSAPPPKFDTRPPVVDTKPTLVVDTKPVVVETKPVIGEAKPVTKPVVAAKPTTAPRPRTALNPMPKQDPKHIAKPVDTKATTTPIDVTKPGTKPTDAKPPKRLFETDI